MTDSENNLDSKARWQAITIAQLSYSINLFLTFTVAALGFSTSLLLNDNFVPESWKACTFYFAVFLFLISGAFGIWRSINRLRDFWATSKITRIRDKKDKEVETQNLRLLSKSLGKKTWAYFGGKSVHSAQEFFVNSFSGILLRSTSNMKMPYNKRLQSYRPLLSPLTAVDS
jgi:hypothetical protein